MAVWTEVDDPYPNRARALAELGGEVEQEVAESVRSTDIQNAASLSVSEWIEITREAQEAFDHGTRSFGPIDEQLESDVSDD